MPYVYELTFKETGQKYIGCRYARGCHPSDILRKYRTSSVLIRKMIAFFGVGAFSSRIIAEVDTPKEAILLENDLIREIGLENLLNMHKGFGSDEMGDMCNDIFVGKKKVQSWNVLTNGVDKLVLPHKVKIPEGFRHVNQGNIPITNGVLRSRKQKDSPMPEGWWAEGALKGKFYITNGKEFKRISKEQTIPPGWWKQNTTQGKILCVTETGNKWLSEDDRIAGGYEKYVHKPRRVYWANNGIEEARVPVEDDLPSGFIKGRLKKSTTSFTKAGREKRLSKTSLPYNLVDE